MQTVTYGSLTLYSAADDSHEFVGGAARAARSFSAAGFIRLE